MKKEQNINEIQNPQLNISTNNNPSFEDWLTKYFDKPKMKIMYKRKDGKGEFDRENLYKYYKKAYKID